jgi:hypothetical protein
MLRWKKRTISDEKLDCLGDLVISSLEVSDSEINAAAQSPFLYRRIRVRIDAEMKHRAESSNPWQIWLLTVRHAIPAMALVTMVTLGTFWMLHEPGTEINESEAAVVLMADGTAAIVDDDLTDVIGWQNSSATQQK